MLNDTRQALRDLRNLQLDAQQLHDAVLAALGSDAEGQIYVREYWTNRDPQLDGPPTRREILQHAFDAVTERNESRTPAPRVQSSLSRY